MPLGPQSDTAPSAFAGETVRGEVAPADTPSPTPTTRANSQAALSQNNDARAPRTRLPSTASDTPAIALAGVIALFAGFGVALWRRGQA